MGFVKVQKNKAYYKRIQTKYRRRREGKTDYFARRKMITQDKNKYNTPKYRLVVRFTKKKIITQVIYSTIAGDRCISQALSTELTKYGCPVGHTNYAACYATGLLIARRTLQKIGMDKDIVGVEEADAEEFHIEETETDRRPFKVVLDVGLTRTISGSRAFGILKGAVDGGLHVPHTIKKFPGASEPDSRKDDWNYDASAHLERILGKHVVEYMEDLEEEDPEKYKVQFGKWIENEIGPDDVEDLYKSVHKKIRADPGFTKKAHSGITNKREGNKITTSQGTTYTRKIKRSYKQRKDRVKQKIQNVMRKMIAGGDDDEDDE